MTIAIINDYVLNRRIKLMLTEEDFEPADTNWDVTDSILAELQPNGFFNGFTTWASLEPFHYRVMLARNIAKLFADVVPGHAVPMQSDTAISLTFLTCALVRCIEKRTGCHVELIRLVRLGPVELAVEFEAALAIEGPPTRPKPEPEPEPESPFTIVVNNVDR